MAVGLEAPGSLEPVAGVRIGTAALGARREPRDDLALFALGPGSEAAAVFTRNAFCAAPVVVARRHLAAAAPRALVINAGNANAATGARGIADAELCCRLAAAAAGCAPEEVLPFSTGVIGEPLEVERFRGALPAAGAALAPDGWLAAARAIMTTDTVPKGRSRRFTAGGRECVLTGIAKGSGMIRPDLATMLAFLATDAAVPRAVLAEALAEAVEASFNRVTVDGDTSTNDACLLVATGASGAAPIEGRDHPDYPAFAAALDEVCRWLAQALARDGEGASKFVTVAVGGGASDEECLRVAYAIAHSPLVKTALGAGDANWGRILAAVGRAGVAGLAGERVGLTLNGVRVVAGGVRAAGYSEALGAQALAGPEVTVEVDLGRGSRSATVWTCDLTHEYVTINAEYRT